MITAVLALLALRYVGRPLVSCSAVGGPCDGRSWTLPSPAAPIWLSGEGGTHHLYRPDRRGGTTTRAYRYVTSAVWLSTAADATSPVRPRARSAGGG